jgi:pimeloyl-ACP methyl ester carboxylesterase
MSSDLTPYGLVGRRLHLVAVLLAFVAVCAGLPGCSTPRHMRSLERYRHGVVYILPGIEGRSPWNRNIALGLDEGGVTSAIEVFDWTVGIPGGQVVSLANVERNRQRASGLADKIVAYRMRYPGRPVHIIGHSGGGGVAVLTLEALPPGRQIDMAILLAPALSPEYDLSTALRRTRAGICNFYSQRDVSFLRVGTTLFGQIDGGHGVSAGAVGFEIPESVTQEDRALYLARLRQVAWDERLRRHGASGTHLGWASRRFAREYLAPLIIHNEANRPLPAELFE